MNDSLYRLEQVRQVYEGREVLSVDLLEVPSHSIVGLTGPNGCGKSTLLRILALLEYPVQGKVIFHGTPATPADSALRRQVTMLGQEPFLLQRSVFANVAYGLRIRGERGVDGRVGQALDMVGLDLEQFGRRPWYQLSGGETQRVALASRLALRPKVLLLDEPTASLDKESSVMIKQAALTARQEWDTTLVIVSHDTPWLDQVCDRLLTMQTGRIVDRVEQA